MPRQWRRWLLGLAVVLAALLACGGISSRASAATLYRAYVTIRENVRASDTLTPIELATNTAGTPIPVEEPIGIAITPNGKTAYVTNDLFNFSTEVTSGVVTPINVATNTAGTPIPVGEDPIGIAITPNDKTAYVVDEGSGTVTPINLANNKAGTPIPVGEGPIGIAITPNDKTAYVTNEDSGTVTPINLANNKAGTPIAVDEFPFAPYAIAIMPNGRTAYVTNLNVDVSSGTVTPINLATNKAGTPIPVGVAPREVAITPNGETAYVTNEASDTVTPISLGTNTAGTPIPVGTGPDGVAVTPNGETAYVDNFGSGTVTPITVATNTAGTPIPAHGSPQAIAITTLNVVAKCSGDSGKLTLSPGLSGTAEVQTLKVKGTLSGCTGEPFTKVKYTATLKTGPVSCSVLNGAGGPASGAASYTWTPRATASTGTLSLPLTEAAGVELAGGLTSGTYSPLTLSGTATEKYAGAATCTTKKVTKGTFTGSAVDFE